MYKALIAALILLGFAACGGGSDPETPSGSPTPTPAPCAGTPEPSAGTYNITLPRVGGDYTRQVPVQAYVQAYPGANISVDIVRLTGGLLGSALIPVLADEQGGLHKVDNIMLIQLIPNKIRACAIIRGPGWKAEIPVRVGGANP